MSEKEKKSKLDPKTRQIIDVVVTAIQVVIVIFCIVLSIIIWTGSAGDPINRKINWFAIRTDSMTRQSDDFYAKFKSDYNCDFDVKKTTFNPGDMVITKKVAFYDIHVGDVIAYSATVTDGNDNLSEQIITHRVVSINKSTQYITTRGDKDVNASQTAEIPYSKVYGKMTGKIAGVGGAVLWLQGYRKVTMADGSEAYDYSGSSVTFLVIIIPLAALFIYNGFYVVKWVMDERMKKVKEAAQKEAADQAAKESVNQKELERKAIRAFMTAQGMTDEQIDEYFAKEDAKEAAKLAEQQAQEQAKEEQEQEQEQAESSEATQEQSEKPEQAESESQETPQD
jgi:signal peptidase I